MNTEKFTAVEVHRVRNGWLVHPTRGWLDQAQSPLWDGRIWVFNSAVDLHQWLGDTLGELTASIPAADC